MIHTYKDIYSICKKCNHSFNAVDNRVYDLRRQNINEKTWPVTFLSYGMKEFLDYQIVKCPHCACTFKENNLKVFGFFNPKQVLVVIFIGNMIFISYAIWWLIKLFMQ